MGRFVMIVVIVIVIVIVIVMWMMMGRMRVRMTRKLEMMIQPGQADKGSNAGRPEVPRPALPVLRRSGYGQRDL